jgi:hypothetical protein
MRSHAIVLLSSLIGTPVFGQQATVRIDHQPNASPAATAVYQLPSDDTSSWRRGLPRLVLVPTGQKACFQVTNMNPVLYTYAAGTEEIKVETPAEITLLLGALQSLTGVAWSEKETEDKLDPKRAPTRAMVSNMTHYQNIVAVLFRHAETLKDLRQASDAVAKFETAAGLAYQKLEEARIANDSAEKIWKQTFTGNSAAEAAAADPVVKLLRAAQLTSWSIAEAIGKEYKEASQHLNEYLCIPVDEQPRTVYLSVKAKPNGPKTPLRVTGDRVAAYEVDPTDSRQFTIGAAIVATTFISGARSYRITDGKVAEFDGDNTVYLPAVTANFRLTEHVWLTFGVSADTKDVVSGAHAGVSLASWAPRVGVRAGVGLGLSLAKVVTGVESPATIGSALPDGTKLEDVLRRETKPGLGITFFLTTK